MRNFRTAVLTSSLVGLVAAASSLRAEPATNGEPEAAPVVTVQHPEAARYLLIPNNWRLRMINNHVQDIGNRFAAEHELVTIQVVGDLTLQVPRAAVREPATSALVTGVKRLDPATGSYVAFAGGVDPRYLPYAVPSPSGLAVDQLEAKAKQRQLALAAVYNDYGLPHSTKALAYAGEGMFNDSANDVWVRLPSGVSFFIDGSDWARLLRLLVSEGQGQVSSLKPDVWDIEEKNRRARNFGLAVFASAVTALAAAGALTYRAHRKHLARARKADA